MSSALRVAQSRILSTGSWDECPQCMARIAQEDQLTGADSTMVAKTASVSATDLYDIGQSTFSRIRETETSMRQDNHTPARTSMCVIIFQDKAEKMNTRISETVRRQGASGKTLEQDSAALQPIKTSTYKTISHDKLERMRESIIKTVRSWRQGYPEGSLRSKHIT